MTVQALWPLQWGGGQLLSAEFGNMPSGGCRREAAVDRRWLALPVMLTLAFGSLVALPTSASAASVTVSDLGPASNNFGVWNYRGDLFAYTDYLGNSSSGSIFELHVRNVLTGADKVIDPTFRCAGGYGSLRWASAADMLLTQEWSLDNHALSVESVYNAQTGQTTPVGADVQISTDSSGCSTAPFIPSPELSADGQFLALRGTSPSLPPPSWELSAGHLQAEYTYELDNGALTRLDNSQLGVRELHFAPTGHRFLTGTFTPDNPNSFYEYNGLEAGDASTGVTTPIVDPAPAGAWYSFVGCATHGGVNDQEAGTRTNFAACWSPDGTQIWVTRYFAGSETGGLVYDFSSRTASDAPIPADSTELSVLGWHQDATTFWVIAEYSSVAASTRNDMSWSPTTRSTQMLRSVLLSSGGPGSLSLGGRWLLATVVTSGLQTWDFIDTTSGAVTETNITPTPFYSWAPNDSYLIGSDGGLKGFRWNPGQITSSPIPTDNFCPQTVSPDSRYVLALLASSCDPPVPSQSFGGTQIVYDSATGATIDTNVIVNGQYAFYSEWSPVLDTYSAPRSSFIGSTPGVQLVSVNPEPPVASLTIRHDPPSPKVGVNATLTATLSATDGSPIAGTLVRFQVMSGPDIGFTAIIATDTTGTAAAQLKGRDAGTDQVQAWVDANANGVLDPNEVTASTTVTWLPTPVTVLFIQGIGSSSTCQSSPDFVGRLGWYRGALKTLVGPGSKFMYYAYRSPYTSKASCASGVPQYSHLDSCWSLDDVYGTHLTAEPVPGGGEATRLATFLKTYLDAHPSETLSVVTHSQGGVLASYAVKQKLSAAYTKRIRAIVTLDSPLRGVNSVAPAALRIASKCNNQDVRLDSPFDMQPDSAVIRRINDSSRPSTRLYTVDANPGSKLGVKFVDDAHSTTWWAASHIQIGAQTHSDVWNGCFIGSNGKTACATTTGAKLGPEGTALVRFTACAVDNLAQDCRAYARS